MCLGCEELQRPVLAAAELLREREAGAVLGRTELGAGLGGLVIPGGKSRVRTEP